MTKPLAGKDWINASQFHPIPDDATLKKVKDRVASHREDKAPLLLFDLDSTLYEVQPRTHAIIQHWADETSHFAENIIEKLKNSNLGHVGYSLKDTFKNLGLSLESPEVEKAWSHLKNYWTERFFSNDYLKHDKPYTGAVEYVKELYGLGAHIIYLTGRDKPRMGIGTEENLRRDGFPYDHERTHLLLKQHGTIEDLTHKKSCLHFVESKGKLLASFENEPLNFVALATLFPEAIHVFVDTVCSDHPAVPAKDVYKISGYPRPK